MTSSTHMGPAIGAMLGAMALFTANDTLMKQVAAELPAFQVVALRGFFATVVLGLFVLATDARHQINRVLDPFAMLRSAIEFVSISCFVVALARLPIADVVALAQTGPLILLSLAALLFRERIGALRWVLVAVGFAGALMVTQPGGAGYDPFLLLALATAAIQAIRDLVSLKVPRDIPFAVVGLSTVGVVTILAGLATLATGSVAVEVWHLGYLAASGTLLAIAHCLLFLAFRYADASLVAPFGYSATLWAVLAGAFVFQENPNALALAGILVLTVSGIALARTRG